MKKLLLIPIFIFVIFLVVIVIAQWNVAVLVNVVPGSCVETDNGADYENPGSISASVIIPNSYPPGTNSSVPASADDVCDGDVLFEGACGNTYGYPGLAGILSLNCSELGNYACQSGACVAIQPPSQNLTLYDDFSSGSLNNSLWEIRQDVEGQPLTDEYGVENENGNFVFHILKNSTGDKRTYLFPNRTFTTGDKFEWGSNLVSYQDGFAGMVLLTGDQYIRIGIQTPGILPDEIGVWHITFEFQQNNLHILRQSPTGTILIDDLVLNQQNGIYTLYIGLASWGPEAHMDFDNFYTS